MIVLGFMLVCWQLRIQRRSHALQAMFALDGRWHSPEMVRARQAVCIRNTAEVIPLEGEEDFVARFFEDLGSYVYRGSLPLPFVWTTYSYEIDHYWTILEPAILRLRTETGDPTFFGLFERLKRRSDRSGRRRLCWLLIRHKRWKQAFRLEHLPIDRDRFKREELRMVRFCLENTLCPSNGELPEV